MRTTCQMCHETFLAEGRRGRTPSFCSSACRQKAYRRRQKPIPHELTRGRRWTARDGKRPVTPQGQAASTTDPSTWTTYEKVTGGPHGVMLGDGLACLDLDHCLADGVLASWAQEAVDRIPPEDRIYSEVSMSGEGVHVFFRSPEGPGSRRQIPGGGGIEVYSRARFIAVTGVVFSG